MSNSMTPISRRDVLIGGAAMVAVTGLPIPVFAGQTKPASAPAPQRKNQGEAQMNTITMGPRFSTKIGAQGRRSCFRMDGR
jgi:hypothetical protein